jgi:hypothetical protein
MDALSDELLLCVFWFLCDDSDILHRVALVCRRWRRLALYHRDHAVTLLKSKALEIVRANEHRAIIVGSLPLYMYLKSHGPRTPRWTPKNVDVFVFRALASNDTVVNIPGRPGLVLDATKGHKFHRDFWFGRINIYAPSTRFINMICGSNGLLPYCRLMLLEHLQHSASMMGIIEEAGFVMGSKFNTDCPVLYQFVDPGGVPATDYLRLRFPVGRNVGSYSTRGLVHRRVDTVAAEKCPWVVVWWEANGQKRVCPEFSQSVPI